MSFPASDTLSWGISSCTVALGVDIKLGDIYKPMTSNVITPAWLPLWIPAFYFQPPSQNLHGMAQEFWTEFLLSPPPLKPVLTTEFSSQEMTPRCFQLLRHKSSSSSLTPLFLSHPTTNQPLQILLTLPIKCVQNPSFPYYSSAIALNIVQAHEGSDFVFFHSCFSNG